MDEDFEAVREVIRVLRRLDLDYLHRWTLQLGLEEMLDRAVGESKQSEAQSEE